MKYKSVTVKDKNGKDIELINDLCESFGVTGPFEVDTCYDLKKYLLYVLFRIS